MFEMVPWCGTLYIQYNNKHSIILGMWILIFIQLLFNNMLQKNLNSLY